MIIYGFYGLMKHLYIIGNGFDCHHGICSSYKAYRTWLQKHHPRLYERLSEFYATDNDEWWWEFELNLGEIDITYYIDSTAYEARPDFASDEFRDRDYHAGEIQAQNEIGKLVADIQITFSEWVGALNRPDYGKKITLYLENSYFINFNYTHTLQDMYGIPNNRICHIHGDIGSDELVLGHNKTYEELQDMAQEVSPEPPDDIEPEELEEWYSQNADDYIIQSVRDAAVREICGIRKDVSSIINNYRRVFNSISSVEYIHVFGFSFSPVDIPYLDEILRHINIEIVKWNISYLISDDLSRIESYLQSQHIPAENYRLFKLEELLEYRQQTLF